MKLRIVLAFFGLLQSSQAFSSQFNFLQQKNDFSDAAVSKAYAIQISGTSRVAVELRCEHRFAHDGVFIGFRFSNLAGSAERPTNVMFRLGTLAAFSLTGNDSTYANEMEFPYFALLVQGGLQDAPIEKVGKSSTFVEGVPIITDDVGMLYVAGKVKFSNDVLIDYRYDKQISRVSPDDFTNFNSFITDGWYARRPIIRIQWETSGAKVHNAQFDTSDPAVARLFSSCGWNDHPTPVKLVPADGLKKRVRDSLADSSLRTTYNNCSDPLGDKVVLYRSQSANVIRSCMAQHGYAYDENNRTFGRN